MRSLYEAFSKQMMATSLRITNSKPDSEDILQESFLHSFQKIEQLKVDEHYGAWLNQIVVNASLKHVKNRIDYTTLFEIGHVADVQEEARWYEGISFQSIKKEIQNLPDGCREIFSLYLMEGYKHTEVAKLLGVSVSTSKSQYRYALKLLKEKLMCKIYE